ncbi:hypothetical protein GCM10022394_13350 [Zobellella aerophila]|uniref:Transposase IS4 N-terminal domain-containing protein n=1 Tax=Zobellella aerophila TaxID=870480 RepID=A0ABP6VJ86_9GAMM
MEAMVWAVIGMALFRGDSVRQLINKLDIVLPQEVDSVVRNSVVCPHRQSVRRGGLSTGAQGMPDACLATRTTTSLATAAA